MTINRAEKDNNDVKELSQLSVEQLDSLALDGQHRLFSSTNRRITSLIPILAGGWVAAWIRTSASVQRMDLILRPSTPRTRDIYMRGLISFAINFNLTTEDAKTWAQSNCRGKHAILPRLAKILYSEDQKLKEAYLDYPLDKPDYSTGSWFEKWFPDGSLDGFTDYDHVAIASLVTEMVTGKAPIKKERTERNDERGMIRTPFGMKRRKERA